MSSYKNFMKRTKWLLNSLGVRGGVFRTEIAQIVCNRMLNDDIIAAFQKLLPTVGGFHPDKKRFLSRAESELRVKHQVVTRRDLHQAAHSAQDRDLMATNVASSF